MKRRLSALLLALCLLVSALPLSAAADPELTVTFPENIPEVQIGGTRFQLTLGEKIVHTESKDEWTEYQPNGINLALMPGGNASTRNTRYVILYAFGDVNREATAAEYAAFYNAATVSVSREDETPALADNLTVTGDDLTDIETGDDGVGRPKLVFAGTGPFDAILFFTVHAKSGADEVTTGASVRATEATVLTVGSNSGVYPFSGTGEDRGDVWYAITGLDSEKVYNVSADMALDGTVDNWGYAELLLNGESRTLVRVNLEDDRHPVWYDSATVQGQPLMFRVNCTGTASEGSITIQEEQPRLFFRTCGASWEDNVPTIGYIDDWSQESVSNSPGRSMDCVFYYGTSASSEQVTVTSSDPDSLRVTTYTDTNGSLLTQLDFLALNDDITLTATVGEEEYTMPAAVVLPEVGFYSDQNRSGESLLNDVNYNDIQTVYLLSAQSLEDKTLKVMINDNLRENALETIGSTGCVYKIDLPDPEDLQCDSYRLELCEVVNGRDSWLASIWINSGSQGGGGGGENDGGPFGEINIDQVSYMLQFSRKVPGVNNSGDPIIEYCGFDFHTYEDCVVEGGSFSTDCCLTLLRTVIIPNGDEVIETVLDSEVYAKLLEDFDLTFTHTGRNDTVEAELVDDGDCPPHLSISGAGGYYGAITLNAEPKSGQGPSGGYKLYVDVTNVELAPSASKTETPDGDLVWTWHFPTDDGSYQLFAIDLGEDPAGSTVSASVSGLPDNWRGDVDILPKKYGNPALWESSGYDFYTVRSRDYLIDGRYLVISNWFAPPENTGPLSGQGAIDVTVTVCVDKVGLWAMSYWGESARYVDSLNYEVSFSDRLHLFYGVPDDNVPVFPAQVATENSDIATVYILGAEEGQAPTIGVRFKTIGSTTFVITDDKGTVYRMPVNVYKPGYSVFPANDLHSTPSREVSYYHAEDHAIYLLEENGYPADSEITAFIQMQTNTGLGPEEDVDADDIIKLSIPDSDRVNYKIRLRKPFSRGQYMISVYRNGRFIASATITSFIRGTGKLFSFDGQDYLVGFVTDYDPANQIFVMDTGLGDHSTLTSYLAIDDPSVTQRVSREITSTLAMTAFYEYEESTGTSHVVPSDPSSVQTRVLNWRFDILDGDEEILTWDQAGTSIRCEGPETPTNVWIKPNAEGRGLLRATVQVTIGGEDAGTYEISTAVSVEGPRNRQIDLDAEGSTIQELNDYLASLARNIQPDPEMDTILRVHLPPIEYDVGDLVIPPLNAHSDGRFELNLLGSQDQQTGDATVIRGGIARGQWQSREYVCFRNIMFLAPSEESDCTHTDISGTLDFYDCMFLGFRNAVTCSSTVSVSVHGCTFANNGVALCVNTNGDTGAGVRQCTFLHNGAAVQTLRLPSTYYFRINSCNFISNSVDFDHQSGRTQYHYGNFYGQALGSAENQLLNDLLGYLRAMRNASSLSALSALAVRRPAIVSIGQGTTGKLISNPRWRYPVTDIMLGNFQYNDRNAQSNAAAQSFAAFCSSPAPAPTMLAQSVDPLETSGGSGREQQGEVQNFLVADWSNDISVLNESSADICLDPSAFEELTEAVDIPVLDQSEQEIGRWSFAPREQTIALYSLARTPETDFNAGLTVSRAGSSGSFTVTVADSTVLAEYLPTLTLPCTLRSVKVIGPDEEEVEAQLNKTAKTVSFPVAAGGVYTVEAGSASGPITNPDDSDESETVITVDGAQQTIVIASDGAVTIATAWDDGKTALQTVTPEGEVEITVTGAEGEVIAQVSLPAQLPEAKTYEDVHEEDWFSESVETATALGLFTGTSAAIFSPGADLTRGMMVTTLYRLSGKPEYGTDRNAFEDVPEDTWYTEAVDWANAVGVAKGNGRGFDPTGTITRQDLVTMLYRYAAAIGANPKERAGLDQFTDGDQVSGYALEPMKWAVAVGIINGKGSGVLDPRGTATRAQAATVLVRFAQYLS